MPYYKMFMTRKEASVYTGISYCAIRKGTIDGSIPCKKIGNKNLINMSIWLKQLDDESRKAE